MALPENILPPLPGENPCGEPAPGLKAYEKLRDLRKPNEAAIEAFLAPRADGKPRIMTRDIWAPKDVRKVVDAASDLLATQSKDLEVAAWLTEALTWRDGFAGLAEGLALLRALLDQYWDTLHPLPDEGDYYMRVRHLEWIGMTESYKDSCVTLVMGFIPVTQSGLTLNQYQDSRDVPGEEASFNDETLREKRSEALLAGKIGPEEFEAAFDATPKPFYKELQAGAHAATAALEALDELCRGKFTTDPPGFTRLKAVLEKAGNTVDILLRRKLDRDPDPVEVAAVGPGGAEGGEVPGAAGGAAVAGIGFDQLFASMGDVSGLYPANAQEAFVRVAAVARFLRRSQPSSAVPYLLVRGLRWGELYAAGDALPESLLAAPPTAVRAQLRALANAGRWEEVLELAESAMCAEYGRGWLDLQRYSVRACEALGYDAAARAIRCHVRHLLQDYPSLVQSTLLDDTGTANPETMQWLAGLAEG